MDGRADAQALDAVKVTAEIILIQVTLLYLLRHLALALSGLLGVLELQPVLVHGESHSLVTHPLVQLHKILQCTGEYKP